MHGPLEVSYSYSLFCLRQRIIIFDKKRTYNLFYFTK